MSTILTDDERPNLPDGTHPQSLLGQMLSKYAIEWEAVALAKLERQEPVVEFMGRRQTPEGTRECWGVLLCEDMQDPAKGTKLYIHPHGIPTKVSSQWHAVMPGGKMTEKWESSRIADYNQGWNDYRKAALRNLEYHAPQQADRQRVPEGWSADPSAAAVELAKMVMSDCGLAVENRHDLLGRIADRISKFAAAPEAPAQTEHRVPDGVWEALQRMIEDGMARGPGSREDAKAVAQWRARFVPARDGKQSPQAEQAAEPVRDEREPSPTAGMTLGQRILHVGGRTNAAGYVEFGSVQAVDALVRHVLRDLPDAPPVRANAEWPREADPLTQLIQRLNSTPYNLTKDECIEVAKELRAALASTERQPLTREKAEEIALNVMGFAVLDKEQEETALMLIRATEKAHSICGDAALAQKGGK